MERTNQLKVQQTLEFIEKDRVIPEDPWFYSRLRARMENETGRTSRTGWAGAMAYRLRPVLAAVLILIAVSGGISLGNLLSRPATTPQAASLGLVADDDPTAALFRELSGTFDEQILLMK